MDFTTTRQIVVDYDIAQPEAILVKNGSTNVPRVISLEGSPYISSYKNGRLVREFQVTTRDDPQFENVVWTGFSTVDTVDVNIMLQISSTYIWRCRDYLVPTDAEELIGEIKPITHLGSIYANYVSTLSIKAQTTVPNATLLYKQVEGSLPNGLTLALDGEITGKPRQFANDEGLGLTYNDSNTTTFDAGTTTIDRCFVFVAEARDRYGYSATSQAFSILVKDPDDKLYSNLYLKPMIPQIMREEYKRIISNPDLFPPEYIYRAGDDYYGLRTDMRMLVFAGIETKHVSEYVAAAAQYHKRRTLRIGGLKTAVAKEPGTNEIIYEVVYLDVIDPAEPKSGIASKIINILNAKKITGDSVRYGLLTDDKPMEFRPDGNTIKADTTGVLVSQDSNNRRLRSNTTNMRDQIQQVGTENKDFLPLWMRTPQTTGERQLDYVNALPLCYCKPGTSQKILINLLNLQYDFKKIHFEIDRYILDSSIGNSSEQYVLFANYIYNT